MKLIAVCLAIVALCGFGYIALDRFHPANTPLAAFRTSPLDHTIPTPIDTKTIDKQVVAAVFTSHDAALEFGKKQVTDWHDKELMPKVDSFLDWYFGYVRQRAASIKQGFTSVFWGSDAAATAALQSVSREFSNQVMPPLVVDKQIEDLSLNTAQFFTTELRKNLANIPTRFNIPAPQWETYLSNISVHLATNDEANVLLEETSLRAFVSGGTVGAIGTTINALHLASPIIHAAMAKMAVLMGTKAAVAAGSSAAAAGSAGASAAAGAGAVVGLATIGAGIVVVFTAWDVWDHYSDKKHDLPIMRQNIEAFLHQFESDLLKDDGAIGAPIYQISSAIYAKYQ